MIKRFVHGDVLIGPRFNPVYYTFTGTRSRERFFIALKLQGRIVDKFTAPWNVNPIAGCAGGYSRLSRRRRGASKTRRTLGGREIRKGWKEGERKGEKSVAAVGTLTRKRKKPGGLGSRLLNAMDQRAIVPGRR